MLWLLERAQDRDLSKRAGPKQSWPTVCSEWVLATCCHFLKEGCNAPHPFDIWPLWKFAENAQDRDLSKRAGPKLAYSLQRMSFGDCCHFLKEGCNAPHPFDVWPPWKFAEMGMHAWDVLGHADYRSCDWLHWLHLFFRMLCKSTFFFSVWFSTTVCR